MYQHILVAVDGSEVSHRALQEAIRLATAVHATLRLAYVVDEVTFNMEGEFIDLDAIREGFRSGGRKILEQAQTEVRAANLEVETRLLEIETIGHRIPDMIVDEAERWPADLIVLGTHGRRGVRHLLLGSVAEGVMRAATAPVLLIRGA